MKLLVKLSNIQLLHMLSMYIDVCIWQHLASCIVNALTGARNICRKYVYYVDLLSLTLTFYRSLLHNTNYPKDPFTN